MATAAGAHQRRSDLLHKTWSTRALWNHFWRTRHSSADLLCPPAEDLLDIRNIGDDYRIELQFPSKGFTRSNKLPKDRR
jgi:hypothetical protein